MFKNFSIWNIYNIYRGGMIEIGRYIYRKWERFDINLENIKIEINVYFWEKNIK